MKHCSWNPHRHWRCERCEKAARRIAIAWHTRFDCARRGRRRERGRSPCCSFWRRKVAGSETAGAGASESAGLKRGTTSALPPGATPRQLAAWTVVARVLLNLDETITVE